MSGHSPSPWFADGKKVFDSKGEIVASTQRTKDALLIVKAVNYYIRQMQRNDERRARRQQETA